MRNRFCRPEKLLSCFFVVFILLFRMTAFAPAEEIRKPKILILNSYHQGVDWTDGIMDGILSCFKKEKRDADLYIEYMDTKRNRPDNIFPSLFELYKLKYQKKKFDVIICSDNNALNFLLRHRDQLFPNVPIVFCGINNFRDSLIAGKKQITGVTEDHDIKGTIELALRLHPETEHVVVICDNTPTGLADMEKLKPILSGFHKKVDFIKIFEFTGKELQQKLQSLPENTVVFSLTFFVDRDGKFYSLEESSALLAKSCDRPIYVVADFRIRNGVLGGVITRAKSQGEKAAEIAVRILKGESVDAIPVLQKGQNIPMFDYQVMKRFGIKVSDLPKDSVVMNKPFSFFDRYKGLIWAAALITSVLLAIVLILIGNIIKRRRTEAALRTAEGTYRNMFLNSQIGLFRTDMKTGMILDANDAVARFIGYKDRSELMAGPFNIVERYVDPKEREKMISLLQAHGEFRNYETRFRRNDGSIIWMRYSAKMVPEKGWIEGVSEDISDQKLAEISLRQSEEKFSKLFFSSPAWMAITRLEDGTYLEVNKAFEEITGFDRSEVIGRTSLELGLWPEPDGERERYMALARERGGFREQQVTFLTRDGEPITALWSAYMMDLAGETCLLSTVMDMSALKRSRVERKKLYAQLLQAQKMESIGRLAGGIAHDFNNKLLVILGRVQMVLMDMEPENPIYEDLEEVQDAAKGSADLTRQLLAFARKQTIAPRELDLNETLEGMLKMLRRLIGEDIDLAWQPDTNLWSVKMDPAQVDQILANLAVNARDAIDGVGKVTIETKNVVLGEAYCAEHVGFVPGEFAMLAVSDNGGGMDKTTLDQIFEPFFSTKEIGKGTGLGLSTVYGIVKQNNGFVNAYSEPGKGTTFKIYLPRYQGETTRETSTGSEETPKGLGETILLVEDDPGILEVVGMMLEGLGYAVLTANGPDEAMATAREHTGGIHLLMTDVVMPRMNGNDLAEQVMKIRPETGTLFMSGYTANAIAHHGILNEGVHFIEKPFMADGLARKVREVLDKTES